MLWHCSVCTAAYSVGAPKCPQCGGRERAEDGEAAPVPITPPADELEDDEEDSDDGDS